MAVLAGDATACVADGRRSGHLPRVVVASLDRTRYSTSPARLGRCATTDVPSRLGTVQDQLDALSRQTDGPPDLA